MDKHFSSSLTLVNYVRKKFCDVGSRSSSPRCSRRCANGSRSSSGRVTPSVTRSSAPTSSTSAPSPTMETKVVIVFCCKNVIKNHSTSVLCNVVNTVNYGINTVNYGVNTVNYWVNTVNYYSVILTLIDK
jgi:hypothetical protein